MDLTVVNQIKNVIALLLNKDYFSQDNFNNFDPSLITNIHLYDEGLEYLEFVASEGLNNPDHRKTPVAKALWNAIQVPLAQRSAKQKKEVVQLCMDIASELLEDVRRVPAATLSRYRDLCVKATRTDLEDIELSNLANEILTLTR